MSSKQNSDSEAATWPLAAHSGGLLVALLFAALWVGLTLRTGVTYHLFPLAIGVLPALVAYRVFEAKSRSWWPGPIGLVPVGPAIVALAWGVLELLNETPTATFIHDQPGGVPAEVAVLGLAGAAVGLWFARPKP